MSHAPKLPPDYSPAFKRMTGFRGTPTGIRPGTVVQSGEGTSFRGTDAFQGRGVKRSPSTPFPAGGKKPSTGKG